LLKENTFNINSINGGGEPTAIITKASLNSSIPVTDPSIEVSICYDYQIQQNSFSGCYSKKIPLQIQFFSYLAPLEKDAPFKLTIETNKELPEAAVLFSEYI
jgi:PTHB1 C-terminus